MAQVQVVSVSKTIRYQQTSAAGVALIPIPTPCFGCPYTFDAHVGGTNIGSIPAPVVSGPINWSNIFGNGNNGRLVYSSQDEGWRFGVNGNGWSGASLAVLNSTFANGTYTFTVNAATIALNLSGDAYPNTPVLRFNQGTWKDGKLEFDPDKPLTITTNAFSAYGSHVNDAINIGINDIEMLQLHSAVPGWNTTGFPPITVAANTNSASLTIPANTFVSGRDYSGWASFTAAVDANLNPGLPGSLNFAAYEVETEFNLKATVAPVFPLTVTSNITPTTANASASIQFKPEDVGTTASVFVFAVAPSSLVKAAARDVAPIIVGKSLPLASSKDGPADCVLAQLNSSGQLIAVTSQQLQAYLSGTLSSQGASVTILNNASTPVVAGATFYVGYGASSAAMFTNGVYRIAVTVPGSSVCPMVSSQTALWWNPAESGWGLNLNHQGNVLFGTLFTYDASRAPMWLVMSNGAMQSDGLTFTGDLYRTTGPAFNANPFTPIGTSNLTKVGSMTVSFQDVNSGTLQYTVNGTQVSKGIQRQVFGTRAAACFPSTDNRTTATNYQDLWWNAAESGWGINVTHQDNTLFATLFTYDATGKGLWLVMSSGTRQADGTYSGSLYRTSGPAFNSNSFTPIGPSDIANVGTMRLRFTDGNNGTLNYTYNGVAVTKAITRQLFSSPVPACN